MTTKATFIKTALFTLAISNSVSAFAESSTLKLAIVGDSTGSNEINKGFYNSSIKKINKYFNHGNSYNNQMNLCVAYLQTDKTIQAETACSAAINSIEAKDLQNDKTLYLTSLSYSNRAISRYKNQNIAGAIDDLNVAVSIDANTIAVDNLKIMQQISFVALTDNSLIAAE